MRYQGWAGKVLFFELADDLGFLGDTRLEWIGNTISGPQDIQSVVTGDIDIGGAFNGAILRLVAAGAPITSVLSYYGADSRTEAGYFVLEDSPIRGPRDFIGKKVGVNTLGAHHEDVLTLYLERAGLTPEEIDSVQLVVVPPVSAEQALHSGQLDVACMTDITREKALARGGIRTVFSDYELLGAFSAGCYVMRSAYLREHADTARRFLAGTARAARWAQTRPRDEVVARFADIITRRQRNEDTEAIRYWRSTGVALPGGLIADREFDLWKERAAETRPALHDIATRDLYTNEFNPYRS
ncbi:ABC transporter substrate-binding protein [Saccharomonospora sp. CUA-673]|uniref:ABC transporter substrate-binding protein n=1 Tax=Saccharomonospora sp. CUA-673 TaxID=1904969 RepID=UPI000B0F469F|nr:ABC transporter substrate-binding protein [Saccharomonospora sp. CUA-673]